MTMHDDELLDRLTMALRQEEPPATGESPSLLALRAAVEAKTDWAKPARAKPRRLRRRLAGSIALPGLAGGLVLLGTGTAFAVAGTPIPRPVRAVVHAVGLPVDSPDVADTRTAESALKNALAHNDDAAVTEDADRLEQHLSALTSGDRRHLGEEPQVLLDEARRHEAGHETTETIPETDDHHGGTESGDATTGPTTTEVHHSGGDGSGRSGGETSGKTSGGGSTSGSTEHTTGNETESNQPAGSTATPTTEPEHTGTTLAGSDDTNKQSGPSSTTTTEKPETSGGTGGSGGTSGSGGSGH